MEIPQHNSARACLAAVHKIRPKTRELAFLLFLLLPGMQIPSAYAGIIVFDLLEPASGVVLDNNSSGQLAGGNIIATLTNIAVPAYRGVFNQTSSRFGINTLGTSLDSSSLVDSVNGVSESLSISFSDTVFLEYFVLSLFSPSEQALLTGPGLALQIIQGLDSAKDFFWFNNYLVPQGQSIQLAHFLGNGFSLERIAVRTFTVAEPGSLYLLLGLLPLLLLRSGLGAARPG